MKEMQEIHEEVFQFLLSEHKKNNNLLFTLRQINRYGRLDKGYWFLGNDDYLVISFWHGRDWMTKVPRISFFISNTGETSLLLSCKDLSRKDIFNDTLISILDVKRLGYESKFESVDGYSKTYNEFKPNEYIESLKHFLKNEKIIVDRAIKGDYCINPDEWMERFDSVDFLNSSSFKKQLKKIEKYRTHRKESKKKYGKLNSFRIQNFAKIKDVFINNITPNNNWIFITGENGSGKTTILKALAVGICQNKDNNKEIISKTSQFSNFNIKVGINQFEKPIKIFDVKTNSVPIDNNIISDGFAAYGAIRLISEGNLDTNIFKQDLKLSNQLTYGLFNPIGILKDLNNDYPLFAKPKELELSLDAFKDNYRETVVDLIEHEQNKYEILNDLLANKIDLNILPSGTRSILILIQDMLIKLQQQQPKIDDPSDYTGIILIDEIDIHLHPKLQIKLIEQLQANFPNIQFIVTTHSPIPLLGAPENSIFLKVENDFEKGILVERIDIDIKDLLPNSLLTSPIFGFEKIINTKHDRTERIRTENDYEEIAFQKILERKIKERKKELGLEND